MSNGIILASTQKITITNCVVDNKVEVVVEPMKRKIKPFTKRFIKKIKYGI